MIPVIQTGNVPADIRNLTRSITFSEDVLAFPAVGSVETFTTTAPVLGTNTFGGVAVDRSVFRKLLKDDRWLIYAAGWVDLNDGNGGTIGLQYVTNAGALVSLGTIGVGGAAGKFAMGPFEVFTGGVPFETIPLIVLTAQKTAGVAGELTCCVIWVRYLPSSQS